MVLADTTARPMRTQAGSLEVAVCAGQRRDAAGVQPVLEELALPARDLRDRGVRKAEAASGEKEPDPFGAEPAVEVGVVVGVTVERRVVRAFVLCQGEQDGLQRLRPRGCVQRVAVGEDSVEIEEAHLDDAWQAESMRGDGSRGEPRWRSDVMHRSHRAEERRCLTALLRQAVRLPRERGGRKDGTVRLQRPRGGVERPLPVCSRAVQVRRMRCRLGHFGCRKA